MLKNHDRVTSIVLFAGTVFLFLHTENFPKVAAFYPRMIIGLMIVLSALMFLRSLTQSGRNKPFKQFFIHPARFVLSALMMLAYIAGVQFLGYYTASFIFIPATAWALGYRNPRVVAATTICYFFFIFIVFDQLFDRPLTKEFFLP